MQHVVVLATLGARRRTGSLRRRGPRPAAPAPEPSPVAIGRATVVGAEPLEDPAGWLAQADTGAQAARAAAVLNRLLHAHRVATADPSVHEVRVEQAIAVRVGFGAGDRVADGRWDRAVELPPAAPRRRSAALRPQERLAAILGGRDVELACEELALRARADLDAGRTREAALQAEAAVRTALAELTAWRELRGLAPRLDELADAAPAVARAAASALTGGVPGSEAEAVEHAVGRLEALLRARSATGF